MSNEFEVKNDIKRKLFNEAISFVDVERVKENTFDYFLGKDHEEVYEEYWYSLRDEWVEELYDRLPQAIEVYGYANGLNIAQGLGYWDWSENSLGIEVTNGETLGFVASYEYVNEFGLVYDVIDDILKDYFGVELGK